MALYFEWHIRAPQMVVLEVLPYYWWEQGCSVEIVDGPQDDLAWRVYKNTRPDEYFNDALIDVVLLVSATDGDGWTTVQPEMGAWDDALWLRLSWEANAPILVGEHNTVVEQKH